MRVIAGEYRGRKLKALKGSETRPTTDRVKEALMSKIISAKDTLDGLCVLDAFAGTGALGIEALSRGASFVAFCDKSNEAIKIISENLKDLKVAPSQYTLKKLDSLSLSASVFRQAFDLVFLDPPYAYSPHEVLKVMDTYFQTGVLKNDALVCYELAKSSKKELEEALNALKLASISYKEYGETSIVLIRKDAQ